MIPAPVADCIHCSRGWNFFVIVRDVWKSFLIFPLLLANSNSSHCCSISLFLSSRSFRCTIGLSLLYSCGLLCLASLFCLISEQVSSYTYSTRYQFECDVTNANVFFTARCTIGAMRGAYAYSGPKNVFLGDFAPKHFGLSSRPPKGTCAKPRILTYRDRQNRSTMATCRRGEETKKNKKKSHKQWYFTHAPRPPT